MSSATPSIATPRRDFLSQLAALTAVAAAGACAPAQQVAAAPTPTPKPATPPKKPTFDDSWTTAVQAATHKAVFDAPEVADGMGVWQVSTYRSGYKDVFGADAAVHPVLVLRHEGTVLAMDDALWQKYALGKAAKYKNPETKRWYDVNPVSRAHTDAEKKYPDVFIEGLIKSGVTVLACNRALTGFAYEMASVHKLDRQATYDEFKAGLIPGVILQPSGVYATLRAQEVGCLFMRST